MTSMMHIGPLQLGPGLVLPDVEVAYTCRGKRAPAGDNAILWPLDNDARTTTQQAPR